MLDVVREFTYPVGLGTFNPYRLSAARDHHDRRPASATASSIAADVEMAVKQQRDHRIVRTALKRDTLRDTYPIQPTPAMCWSARMERVAAAGVASRQADGRFASPLPPDCRPGQYTASAAVFLDGNTHRYPDHRQDRLIAATDEWTDWR